MQVQPMPVNELVNDPNNARTHDERNLDAIRASLERFGQQKPIVINADNTVVAGNGTLAAAISLGWESIDVVRTDLNEVDAVLYAIADNRTAELAAWNAPQLHLNLVDLDLTGTELDAIGFTPEELSDMIPEPDFEPDGTENEVPDVDEDGEVFSQLGTVYELGPHRLMCGDSTDADQVAKLVGDDVIDLLHADPPYGMGKEADGVLNDNLYKAKLDAFQMDWIRVWLEQSSKRASLYVWGNAEDLWRLWYVGGLAEYDELTMRNELVWDKGSGFGMKSPHGHSYPPASERCLHMMRGQQFLGMINKDDYWEGYEPLRTHMVNERDKCGWTNKDVNRMTGTHMAGHWFTKSQFYPISEAHYNTLQEAAAGRGFCEPYDQLFGQLFGETKAGGNEHKRELSAQLREDRSYFDNAHEAMTDVWQYPRVVGEQRFGHPTPKNAEMIGRICKTSAPDNGWVGEPFGGTGTTMISAQMRGRRCLTMELDPRYCDVIRRRWTMYAETHGLEVGSGALR